MEESSCNVDACPCGDNLLGGEMIKCTGIECDGKFHHLKCAKLKEYPKGNWICPTCKASNKKAREIEVQQRINVTAELNVLKEAEVDLEDIPSSEITRMDIDAANKRENEMRVKWLQSNESGPRIITTMEHWLKLAKSKIHGRGVYAIKDIRKNLILIEYTGELIPKTEEDARERYYREEGITSYYLFDFDETMSIDATKTGSIARFINHSCFPNVYADVINGKLFFISRRNIYTGDELSVDYYFKRDPVQPRIECKCGSLNCRKYMDYVETL